MFSYFKEKLKVIKPMLKLCHSMLHSSEFTDNNMPLWTPFIFILKIQHCAVLSYTIHK